MQPASGALASGMFRFVRTYFFWAAAAVLVLVSAAVVLWEYDLLFSSTAPPPITAYQSSEFGTESFWRQRIQTVGAAQAYSDHISVTEAAPLSEDQRHIRAHVFGGALFDAVGVNGFTACGTDFEYGCFHEFAGRAIAQNGIGSIADLNTACLDTFGDEAHFCQHGIGHGIQTHFGYSEQDFFNALEVCGNLPENDPIGGCRGGVFMEYNFRTMLGPDSAARISDDPFFPCTALKGDDLLACHYWLPDWWHHMLLEEGQRQHDAFAHMGKQCRDMAGKRAELLQTCFRGIGNIAAPATEYQPDQIRSVCDTASSNTELADICYSEGMNVIQSL